MSSRFKWTSVHPRVRGEQAAKPPATGAKNGSSPRARGTGGHQAAGSSSNAVHPRVRGEQARGERAGRVDDRFIPACAGNRP